MIPDKIETGDASVLFESGTTAITGNFSRIEVVTAATFSLLTAPKATGDAMTGIAFPANFAIKTLVTAFTLSSGSVLAYRA